MSLNLAKRLINVDEYYRMAEVGILKDDHVELIRGEMLSMSPIDSRHAAVDGIYPSLRIRFLASITSGVKIL